MPGALPASQIPATAPARASEGPPPGVFDTLGASFRTASDDVGEVQRARLREAYSPLVKALRERNGKGATAYNSWQSFVPVVSSFADLFDGDAVWRDIEAARAADPKAFAELPKTRAEFEQQVLTRGGDRLRDQRLLARSTHGIAAFAGAVPAQFRDPLNLATAPIGGGAKTLAQAFLREAVINGAIEAVQQVPLAQARERMGEELTGGEVVGNVLTGAAFGGLLGLGGKAVADHWAGITAAPKAVQEKAWAAIVDKVPGLRDRVGATVDWNALDDHLPDIVEAVIAPERLTDAERGAVAALRRESAIAAANPFMPDGAGNAAYYRALGETMQGIMDGAPAYVPAMPVSPRARLRSGTSVASGVAGDAMATVKSRIGVVESGGRANARNPRSSAEGLYQFTDGTWLAYYKRRYGAGGLSNAQIIAKKRDVDIQNALMDDLMGDNARALQQAGHAADAGNLYLAHFAGRKGATDLLEADPGATARAVLGDRVVNANPFLKGMTAGDVIAWAHRKMGGEAPVGVRASRETGEAAFARLDEELDRTRAEIEALDAEMADSTIGVRGTLEDLAEEPAGPQLRRELFDDEQSWRAAQDALDAGRLDDSAIGAAWERLRYGRNAADLAALERAVPELEPQPATRMAGSFDEARQVLADFFGRDLPAADGALTVRLTRNGWDKLRSGKAVDTSASVADHIAALANLPELLGKARLLATRADDKARLRAAAKGEDIENAGNKAIHRLGARLESDGRDLGVLITVKETRGASDPNPVYSLQSVEVRGDGGPGPLAPPEGGIELVAARGAPQTGQAGPGADIGMDGAGGNAQPDLFAGEERGPMESATWRDWDDPDGAAAANAAESMEHDLRATAEGDAPKPAAEQLSFRLEEEGEEVSAADLLAEFDEDAAFLKTVKDCL